MLRVRRTWPDNVGCLKRRRPGEIAFNPSWTFFRAALFLPPVRNEMMNVSNRLTTGPLAVFAAFTAILLVGFPRFETAALRAQPARDAVDASVANGVSFLLTQQNADGSFVDKRGRDQHHTVMTALALMAMASVGNLPSDPTVEGDAMRKAIDFLVREDRQDGEGYFGRKDGSRMYGHGIITLALSEMLGMAYIRGLEVATFYFMFQLQPVGSVAHIQVCGTTSCMICGAEDLVAVCKERIATTYRFRTTAG